MEYTFNSDKPQLSFSGAPNELNVYINAPQGVEMVRSFLAPIVSNMMGIKNATFLPSVSPGQGVGEAVIARNIITPAWRDFSNETARSVGNAVSTELTRIARGGPFSYLGPTGLLLEAASRVFSSSVGGGLSRFLLMSSPTFQSLVGGDIMASAAKFFAYRSLFTPLPSVLVSPIDVHHQAVALRGALQAQETLQQFFYGAVRTKETDGSYKIKHGILPDFQATRGFRIEEVTDVYIRGMASGRLGGLNQDQIRGELSQMLRTFEVIGDLLGSREIRSIFTVLDQLAGSRFSTIDMNALGHSLRQIEALAVQLNISKSDMLNTVMSIQNTLRGTIGVTPSQVSAGMVGGALGGVSAANVVMSHVAAAAGFYGTTAPEDLTRITGTITGLTAIGLNSTSGRALRAAAYMRTVGEMSDEHFKHFLSSLRHGSMSERTTVINSFFDRYFGSVARGMMAIRDPYFMRIVDETIPEGSGIATDIIDTILYAQKKEFRESVYRSNIDRIRQGMAELGGFGALPKDMREQQARFEAEKIIDYYSGLGHQAVGVYRTTFSDYIEEAKNILSRSNNAFEGLSRVRMLFSQGTFGKFLHEANQAAEQASVLEMARNPHVFQNIAAHEDTSIILRTLQEFGYGKDQQGQRALSEISGLLSQDPIAAKRRSQQIVDSLVQQNVLTTQQHSILTDRLTSAQKLRDRRYQHIQTMAMISPVLSNDELYLGWVEARQRELVESLYNIDFDKVNYPGVIKRELLDQLRSYLPEQEIEALRVIPDQETLVRLREKHASILRHITGARIGAMRARGYPIDYWNAVTSLVPEGTLYDVRAISQSIAVFNQKMADLFPASRGNIGQILLSGLGASNMSSALKIWFGIPKDATPDTHAAQAWSRLPGHIQEQIRAAHQKIKAVEEENSGAYKDVEDYINKQERSKQSGLRTIIGDISSMVMRGDITDDRQFDEFINQQTERYSLTEADKNVLRRYYDAQKKIKQASEEFSDVLKTPDVSDAIEQTEKEAEKARKVEQAQRQYERSKNIDIILSKFGGFYGTITFKDMKFAELKPIINSPEFDEHLRALFPEVNDLSDLKNKIIENPEILRNRLIELAPDYEDLNKLSDEQLGAVRYFSQHFSNLNSKPIQEMKLSGVLTLRDGDGRTSTYNMDGRGRVS